MEAPGANFEVIDIGEGPDVRVNIKKNTEIYRQRYIPYLSRTFQVAELFQKKMG